MTLWLARTAQNQILGPCPQEQIAQWIQDGKLGPEDEVCPANGYWFTLHEAEELKKHLGIQMPRLAAGDDEVTQTQTQALGEDLEEKTDPDIGGVKPQKEPEIPELPPIPDDPHGTTMVGSNRQEYRALPTPKKPSMNIRAEAVGDSRAASSFETHSLWKAIAVILGAIALVIAFALFRLTRG